MAEFTAQDALTWLGITEADYMRSWDIVAGRHGNPLGQALLDARIAHANGGTPADVLARLGIDPADPLAAVRAYDKRQTRYDDTAQ